MNADDLNLKDVNFPANFEYSSDGNDIPIQFYLDVLPRCKIIYLKLGYFSSTAIRVLSFGFAQFIYNGGKIGFITNHYLYKNDKELMDHNNSIANGQNKRLFQNLKWLTKTLQGPEKHFIECLKYLVNADRIVLLPVQLKPSKMLHYKQGIFFDKHGASVYMDGSCNFTASGLLENAESMSIYRSWGTEFEKSKIAGKREEFEAILNKQNPDYIYLDKELIKESLDGLESEKSIAELLKDELVLIGGSFPESRILKVLEKSKAELQALIDQVESMPRFPFSSEPREYQNDAYKKWVASNKQGIFAMATGTGKTITSLNCLLNEYRNDGYYQALITVPTKILLNQWYYEVRSFNFTNVVLVSSDHSDWKAILSETVTSLAFNAKKSFVIIVTYSSLTSRAFSSKLPELPETTIFIADEAHNIGQAKIKKILPSLPFQRRIALSATPKRAYDPEGNALIEQFFHSFEPYTFSYSMEKAILNGHLCEYEYHPHIVSLDEQEMEEYVTISRELLKYYDYDTRQLKKIQIVEILLQERKRIIHRANRKLGAFRKILDRHMKVVSTLKNAFVYVPEGRDKEGMNLLEKYMSVLDNAYPFVKAYAYTHASDNRMEIMDNFEKGYIDVLFSMKCLDEGVDIPRAEFAIFCSSTGNPRQFIQRRGRVLRKHKDKAIAIIHDLIVIPSKSYDTSLYPIERNLLKSELIRVVYFASLSRNYYEAMNLLKGLATEYQLDMFALESELRGD